MQAQEIRDLFSLQNVLAARQDGVGVLDATDPELLAALVDWKNGDGLDTVYTGKLDTPAAIPAPASKARKAKQAAVVAEPTPDPSDESEPDF